VKKAIVVKWGKRAVLVLTGFVLVFAFVVFPLAASWLITNSRFRFPERGVKDPQELGLTVTPVSFTSADGVDLSGWWNAGQPDMPAILFCHGLNRSRLEMLQRAAESNRKGYGVLLFDVRNHGESGRGHTTLGIHESRDVCAASRFVREAAPERPQLLWGVSMGASTALLAAGSCGGFSGVAADSSFLSFRETISHHLSLIFGIPPFPIANLITAITAWRVGFDPDDGDVEDAVRKLGDVPVLFIAGSEDARMPPALARRLFEASSSPFREIVVIPGATHGNAFSTDPATYMDAVFGFFRRIVAAKAAS
jgi:alpha-beta hydrolase superfamily lysophospholipase